MYSRNLIADILRAPKKSIDSKIAKGLFPKEDICKKGKLLYSKAMLSKYPGFEFLDSDGWEKFCEIPKNHGYSSVELFAGCGGLALGFEKAGFEPLLLNELNKDACETLRLNRKGWNIKECDIKDLSLKEYRNKIDVLTGGFPCQAFSYAGKRLGFEDARGTLFYEFARCLDESKPKIFVAENVRGLTTHDSGRTLSSIKTIIDELGYDIISEKVMQAIFYRVPQKRERLIIVGIRRDLADDFEYKLPPKYPDVFTVKDALKKGKLFPKNVPKSTGQTYPKRKEEIMAHVPEGGYWRDLPDALQREYMKGSYFLGGGKTGIARRLSWDEPSLTLVTSPAQGQTERCHPEHNRPLTVREYARIQTFPDDWEFAGSNNSIYKQIGNAVPVNLSYAIGVSIFHLLESLGSGNILEKRLDSQFTLGL